MERVIVQTLNANFGLSDSKIPLRAVNDNPAKAEVADVPIEIALC
jgi:hypothetical protein